MNRIYGFFLVCLLSMTASAQQLNCEVVINAELTGGQNISVFKTLENALREFVNQTDWTGEDLRPHERINCSMFINITGFDSNSFTGTLQVQSSRPVFGSTHISPVFNFKDDTFNFDYTEYENLEFSPNSYTSNLVSIISFYVYTILGLDADTFELLGGSRHHELANQISSIAQQGNYSGWRVSDGNNSRFRLNSDLLSNAFVNYREALYNYHREGLDLMHSAPELGKRGVAGAILKLGELNSERPNSLLIRTFFDAKAREVEQVFSGGPAIPIREVVEDLNRMAPTFSDHWANIRY